MAKANKFTKEMTTKLIKYVARVDIKFNPIDARSTSCKEMWNQLGCERFQKANPKLKLNVATPYSPKPPVIDVSFVDGSEMSFESEHLECKQMLKEMFIQSRHIAFDYEVNNKAIE